MSNNTGLEGYNVPITMQQVQRCCICRERKPRHQFSVVNCICLECFDRSYAFCERCGTVVYRRNTGITHSQYQQANLLNGLILCDRCDHYYGGSESDGRCWQPKPLDISVATYDRIRSKRKYGVEIETSCCTSYCNLGGQTRFGSKYDCTVSGCLLYTSPSPRDRS